jgi:16S rRNA (guanine527-N7)-methyltransferase
MNGAGPDLDGWVPRETDIPAIAEYFGPHREVAERYAEILSSSGAERGLIGPREVPRLWERHLLNCVAIVDLIEPGARVVDVGSGAGLPGLVVAIARPDISVTLLEPLLRRVTWLDDVIGQLGLKNVVVHRGRAEDRDLPLRDEPFDVATARAVAPLTQLVKWALPLVRPEGQLLAMKGATAADELAGAVDVITAQGGTTWEITTCGDDVLESPTTVVRIIKGQQDQARADERRKRRTRSRKGRRY